MKIKAVSVEALDDYKIFVSFTDGVKGLYDLSDLAGKGVFKSWDKDNNFHKVFINEENGAITWPGDIDIDTLNAYLTIRKIEPEDFFKSSMKHAPNI